MAETTRDARQSGITAITIENFKGISAPVTIPLRPITLLFGANSAGKSTVIQALLYARDLLQRNNTDADVPIGGGNAIDLGGFRNMVHKHELSRTIRIGFEITPDDDGLPSLAGMNIDDDYWQTLETLRISQALLPDLAARVKDPDKYPDTLSRLEAREKSLELVAGRKPDISGFIQKAGIQFAVTWDANRQRPWLSELIYSLDGRSAFRITQENEGAIPFITQIDSQHPSIKAVFTPILGTDAEESAPNAASEFEDFFREREDSQGRVLLKGQETVIPELTRPLPLGVSYETESGDYGYEFFIAAMVNQIVLGTTSLLEREFERFRYVGPIRERPQRDRRPPAVIDESRWADGSAAWDLILRSYDPALQKGDAFVQEISQWMSQDDKLDLGYTLDVLAHRSLPEESMLMANLRLLREKFDEKDQEFYRSLIWPAIENAETHPRIQLHDLRNGAAVGPTDIGMGVIQVTPVLVASLDPQKPFLCVEQPELHLHPAAQARMGDLIVSQARKERRFIIETHSETLMLRIFRRIRETTRHKLPREELEIAKEGVALLFISASTNGTSISQVRLDDHGKFVDPVPGGFFEEGFEELF